MKNVILADEIYAHIKVLMRTRDIKHTRTKFHPFIQAIRWNNSAVEKFIRTMAANEEARFHGARVFALDPLDT